MQDAVRREIKRESNYKSIKMQKLSIKDVKSGKKCRNSPIWKNQSDKNLASRSPIWKNRPSIIEISTVKISLKEVYKFLSNRNEKVI